MDKYDYLEDNTPSRTDTKPQIDPMNAEFYAVPRNPGGQIITAVDPKILQQNGDSIGPVVESTVSAVNVGQRLLEQKRARMPVKHSEISIAKKSHINHAEKKEGALRRPKGSRFVNYKRSRVPMLRPQRSSSWRYGKDSNVAHQEIDKRSEIIVKKLPPNVDAGQLEIDGFVCICPEHFKGQKCERKRFLSFLSSFPKFQIV